MLCYSQSHSLFDYKLLAIFLPILLELLVLGLTARIFVEVCWGVMGSQGYTRWDVALGSFPDS